MTDWKPIPLLEGSENHASSESLIHLTDHFAGINVSEISTSTNNTSELLRDRSGLEKTHLQQPKAMKPLPRATVLTPRGYEPTSSVNTRDMSTFLTNPSLQTAAKSSSSSFHSYVSSVSLDTVSTPRTTAGAKVTPEGPVRLHLGYTMSAVGHDEFTSTGPLASRLPSSFSLPAFSTAVSTPASVAGAKEQPVIVQSSANHADEMAQHPKDLSVGSLTDDSVNVVDPEENLHRTGRLRTGINYLSQALLEQARCEIFNDHKKISASMGLKIPSPAREELSGQPFELSRGGNPSAVRLENSGELGNGLEREVRLSAHASEGRLSPRKAAEFDRSSLQSGREPSTVSYTSVSAHHQESDTDSSTQSVIEMLASEAHKKSTSRPTQVVPGSNLDRLDRLWQDFLKSPYAQPPALNSKSTGSQRKYQVMNAFNSDAGVLQWLQNTKQCDGPDLTNIYCTCNVQQQQQQQVARAIVPGRISPQRNVKSTGYDHKSKSAQQLLPTASDYSPVLRSPQPFVVLQDVSRSAKPPRPSEKSTRSSAADQLVRSGGFKHATVQTSPRLLQPEPSGLTAVYPVPPYTVPESAHPKASLFSDFPQTTKFAQRKYKLFEPQSDDLAALRVLVSESPSCETPSTPSSLSSDDEDGHSASTPPGVSSVPEDSDCSQPSPIQPQSPLSLQQACMLHNRAFVHNCQYRQSMMNRFSKRPKSKSQKGSSQELKSCAVKNVAFNVPSNLRPAPTVRVYRHSKGKDLHRKGLKSAPTQTTSRTCVSREDKQKVEYQKAQKAACEYWQRRKNYEKVLLRRLHQHKTSKKTVPRIQLCSVCRRNL